MTGMVCKRGRRRPGARGGARLVRRGLTVLAAVLAGSAASGCSRPAAGTDAAGSAVGAARCAQNRAAGPIVFLTSFAYAPTSSIVDVVTAEQLGYYKALCLDVRIQPGSTNEQLLSAGTAQIAGLGDAASLMAAQAHGAAIVGVATYGDTSAVELITLKDRGVRSLAELKGKTIGYKVALAPQVAAMLAGAGVPIGSVKLVSVGYNPVSLANGSVDALISYKSNEPRVLASQGVAVTEWDPERYGVRSTFNVLAANRAWAAAHPTAVEDFLRATLRAYGWINAADANLDRALGFLGDRSMAGFDMAKAKDRWRVEARMIAASQPPGTPLGLNSPERWRSDAQALVQAGWLSRAPDAAAAVDNRFVQDIYQGDKLIWPAP
jgi:putative hydroxymethylpyrimidine transport system substrate-binding protein